MRRPLRLFCTVCMESMLMVAEGTIHDNGFFYTEDQNAVKWISSHISPRIQAL